MKLLPFVIFSLIPMLAAPLYAENSAASVVSSAEHPLPILALGGATFQGWTGLKITKREGTLKLPGEAVFRYPQGSKGWYVVGFRKEHDGTRDWRSYYGLKMDVWVPKGRSLRLRATAFTPTADLRQDYPLESHADMNVASVGQSEWQHVTVPLSSFNVNYEQFAFWKFVQGLRLDGTFADGNVDEVRIKNLRLTRAPQVALDASVRGRSVEAGQTARYDLTLSNPSDLPQDVMLRFDKNGFDTMVPSVEPARVHLAPGASASCVVSVKVPESGVARGGHERQTLLASGNGGNPVGITTFITARDVERPSILHASVGWDEVRDKVAKYDWAKKAADEIMRRAGAWNVPLASLPPNNYSESEKHAFVFTVGQFASLSDAAYAWQLTRDRQYAEKAALFLRRLADEKTGYPLTLVAQNQGGPQEGENMQRVAIAYDAILDAGVLSKADKNSIEHTFRLYMETFEPELSYGNMGNWGVAQSTAALMMSFAMGDLAAAQRYIDGPCGFKDFLSKGVMDDGWWWECSTSYNGWVASELTQEALAARPWGIDLVNLEVPANFSPNAMIMPWGLSPLYGMSFEKWGPNYRNTRSLKMFWDAVPRAADYRGIVFGMNDGHEEKFGGQRLELAYFVFRDPAYATLIKQSGSRDLLYGVPELPSDTPAPYLNSTYAENIGYSLLRSQTPGREPREQIQSVLKIGTQGGYHGHFDRTALNNLTRYGRSFWNPETIWWGYPNYMYKFYVQTSVNHNMVVVDQKQQEAVPPAQLLFHSGPMMQAVAQETNACWSDPPYGGMQYFTGDTFASQMKKNRQSVPLATDRKYGEMGPMSDRVLQRRLEIVTDDYVVLADYLKGEQPHTFDNLFQMKALQSLDAPGKTFLRHEVQFNPDPRSAAQFITDANWYQAQAPALAKFQFPFGPGADNAGTTEYFNEPGTLKVDVHSLWPPQQDIMTAMPPEQHGNQQWVTYSVSGDGKELVRGESGMWILGAAEVDVPVQGMKELTLSVSSDGNSKKSALFWGNARLVTADGKEISLAGLPADNVLPSPQDQDYYGGPIKIAGALMASALPTQPQDAQKPALIHIALSGKNAVRFKATLGGDFPFGPETQRRQVYSVRTRGTQARFLTVLEPYEKEAVVKSAVATGPDTLRVELSDGRVQEITIANLEGNGKDIQVSLSEIRNGNVVRSEKAAPTSRP